ncbi:MAG: hypothetical protein HOK69_04295, partial [Gammaproteobacteria bacterium]|nr:hypothetical protein [Gammaproteobacteria bacterium]
MSAELYPLEQWIWLAPLFPLIAASWIAIGYIVGWNRNEAGERETSRVTIAASLLSLLSMLVIDLKAL